MLRQGAQLGDSICGFACTQVFAEETGAGIGLFCADAAGAFLEGGAAWLAVLHNTGTKDRPKAKANVVGLRAVEDLNMISPVSKVICCLGVGPRH